ncbi:MAG: stage III sporulation protein AA [Bacillota bacterium]|nr:stage III sporulation protein AA [Bacillota bacterium]
MEHPILQYMPISIARDVSTTDSRFLEALEEVRLRRDAPVCLCSGSYQGFLKKGGGITKNAGTAYFCNEKELLDALNMVTSGSVYALAEEFRRGYITLQGGHRVGLAGRVIVEEGHVKTMRSISSLNYRIAKEVKGIGKKILPFLVEGKRFLNTLIISPPRCGKTTLLRDLVRILSNGEGIARPMNISLVDERSEIAGSYLGHPQLNVGCCTDILDSAPKEEGMMMAIRSLAPDILVTDEIGSLGDGRAVREAVRCGISLLLSAHGSDMEDIMGRPMIAELMADHLFRRFVVLSAEQGPGTIHGIFDESGASIC